MTGRYHSGLPRQGGTRRNLVLACESPFHQDSRFLRFPVVPGPSSHYGKTLLLVKGDGGRVRFAHLQVDPAHTTSLKLPQNGRKQRPSFALVSVLTPNREVQYLSLVRHLTPAHKSADIPRHLAHKRQKPFRHLQFLKALSGPSCRFR